MSAAQSLLLVAHQDDAPPGLFGEWAGRRRLDTHIARADRAPLPDPALYDLIVVLDADANATDLHLPWLREERAWLAEAIRSSAVLGVGFGARLLTLALNGRVRRLKPEIGWITVTTEDPSTVAPGPWLSWQEDVIHPPDEATVIARDDHGVQVYRHGPHLAVQFHPHATVELVDRWRDRDAGHDPFAQIRLGQRMLRRAPVEQSTPHALRLFDGFAKQAVREIGHSK